MSMLRRTAGSAVVLVFIGTSYGSGRALQDPALRFDVASIRRVAETSFLQSMRITQPGQIAGQGDLTRMINFAYDLQPEDLIRAEGPSAKLLRERFEIVARAPGATSRSEFQEMMRNLLNDRFGLEARFESTERRVLVLRQAVPGKLGRGLKPFDGECKDLPFDLSMSDKSSVSCRLTTAGDLNARVRGTGTVLDFARLVSLLARRTILDRTGLTNRFEVDLTFNRSTLMSDAIPGDAPSFTDAIRDQLGIVLVTEDAQMRTLVIQKVHSLTEN